MATGIICEYNPLHLGHKKQLDIIRAADPDGIIVCLMSGNYVQRGMPSIIDKSIRAKAAVTAGADLVLELPVTAALSSAEWFATEGVRILSPFCTHLCFGAETADVDTLMQTAHALLHPDFSQPLRAELDKGLSFPAARAAALEQVGIAAVTKPNDILAVEYCKAILKQNSSLIPWPIQRGGEYHDEDAHDDSHKGAGDLLSNAGHNDEHRKAHCANDESVGIEGIKACDEGVELFHALEGGHAFRIADAEKVLKLTDYNCKSNT